MAKKKPQRAAGRKPARGRSKKTTMRRAKGRGAARSAAPKRKAAKKSGPKSRATTKRKTAGAAPAPKKAAKVAAKTRPAAKTTPKRTTPSAAPSSRTSRVARRTPNLDRERRTATDAPVPTPPSSLNLDRSASAARTGRAELNQRFREHTSTGPAMTAGDIDADWEAAESIGDEAPGGDNPTPDQDVVDEIGKALGVEYDDDEELQGGDEITKRDRNRWELDPASSDDFDDRED
jgi:hypothetical protein